MQHWHILDFKWTFKPSVIANLQQFNVNNVSFVHNLGIKFIILVLVFFYFIFSFILF